MIKLLSANLYRLFHSLLYWVICLLIPVYNIGSFLSNQSLYPEHDFVALRENSILFNHLGCIGFIAALTAGLLIGDEFESGTLRCKMVSGHTRNSIYLSYFLMILVGMLVIHVVSIGASLVVELIFYDVTMEGIREFLVCLAFSIVPIACFSAIVLLCICLSQKKALGTVISVTAVILMSFPAGQLQWYIFYSPQLISQGALTRKQLDTYLILERIFPDGFSNQLINDIGYLSRGYFTGLPAPLTCGILTMIFLIIGMVWFEDTDLK